MATTAIRDRRRVLRYRNLVQRQAVQMKNRISGLLMETGVNYNKLRLHRMGYFHQLLKLCREHIDRSIQLDRTLLRSLEQDPMLSERLQRLRTVPGVGPITALTWVLEVGDTSRFRSIKQAALRSPNSATSISSGCWSKLPDWLRATASSWPCCMNESGNAETRIEPTLAMARKMVAHMLAVDRRKTDFIPEGKFRPTAA